QGLGPIPLRINMTVLEFGIDRIQNPSLDDVRDAMSSAKSGDGPPEVQLLYGDEAISQPQLWLMCLFSEEGNEPEWCVRFVRYKAKSSRYLASEMPTQDLFVERVRCGCPENIRKECVLSDDALVAQAIEWFLKHGAPMPSLVWLDSDASVLDQ